MSSNERRFGILASLVPVAALALSLSVFGCGSSGENVEEWETAPVVSPNAMLEYKVDSLQNENRRLQDQIEAVAAENRKLTARNAELETKLTEAMSSPKATTTTPDEKAPAANTGGYDGALAKFHAKDYSGAITDFQALIDSGIEASLADNCHYWIGESQYGQKQYKSALKTFQGITALQRSGKKADATFMIGNCQLALGNKADAKESFQKVVADFPTSPLVEKAKEKLAKLP
jgi:tol-pal system protein YbgF